MSMKLCRLLIGVLLAFGLAAGAVAQNDWPVHRADQLRTGVVNKSDGPGPGYITWWWPLNRYLLRTITVDNTDAANTARVGTWTVPALENQAIGFYGDDYEYARCVAADDITDPSSGSTRRFTWTLTPASGYEGDYALYVQFPTGGTYIGGYNVTPNALYGVYEVEWTYAGQEQSEVFLIQHTVGGQWVRVGDYRLFHASSANPVYVTLHNTVPLVYDGFGGIVPLEDPDDVIVTADAAFLYRPPASAQSSPIVITNPDSKKRIYITYEIESPRPSDETGSTADVAGHVACIAPPYTAGTEDPAFAVWDWSPASQSNVNNVVDDTSSSFKKDSAWVPYQTDPEGDYYGTRCYETFVTNSEFPSDWKSARWEPELQTEGNYDIYAWFPSQTPGHPQTGGATYIIHYFDGDDGLTEETFTAPQYVGGQWVRLGAHSYPNDPDVGTLYVELVNYSAIPGEQDINYVMADAIMFVGEYESGIISTPAFYAGVRVKGSDGVVSPKDVVFVADLSGHLYMLDAHGSYDSLTGTGYTWAYWSYPSVPDANDPDWEDPNEDADEGAPSIGPFMRTTVCVANLANKDVVIIGGANGRVYAIDCTGRGDYDKKTLTTGTTERIWTYPDAVPDVDADEQIDYGLRVEGSPAYSNGVVFFPTTEGRVYALDAQGNGDGTTDEEWIYPGRALDGEEEEDPIGPILGTVSVVDFGTPSTNDDLVVFGTSAYSLVSGGTLSGRVVALRAHPSSSNKRTTREWVYPSDEGQSIANISYGGVTYVKNVEITPGGPAYEVVYTGTDAGRGYCINAQYGNLLWESADFEGGSMSLGGAIRSVPTWMQLIPYGATLPVDSVVFTTAAAEIIGLRATESDGKPAGSSMWAAQSTDNAEVFGSLAVSDGYMYALDSSGRLLAFSSTAVNPNLYDAGYVPIQTVEPPGEDTDAEIVGTVVERIGRDDYNALRRLARDKTGTVTPYTAVPLLDPILEWGETVYLVAYNFHTEDHGGSVTFQLKGPSNTPRGTASVQWYDEPDTEHKDSFALYAYVIQGTRQSPFTPGEEYSFEATVRPPNMGAVGPFVAVPTPLWIANPIAVSVVPVDPGVEPPFNDCIGWTTQGTDEEAKINGSGLKADTVVARQGTISHGQRGGTEIMIADRSLLVFSTGRPLRFVVASRHDLLFTGGAAAMYKPLPWEIPPVGFPNPSPDYPDIDRRQLGVWADPHGSRTDLLTNAIQLTAPLVKIEEGQPPDPETRRLAGTLVGLETQVPLYQPANVADGYVGKIWVFVDVDNTRQLSGVTTSYGTDIPTSGAEPYRSFRTQLAIPPDEKIVVVEPTVDLGELAHGMGMTPYPPRDDRNEFLHSSWLAGALDTYDAFFKPFTVQSYSNVNLLNLRVASIVHPVTGSGSDESLLPVGFVADGVSPLAWLGADQALVSNLDPRFSSQVTLHKPRPGDRSPTSLRLPDSPYGTTNPAAVAPMVGVAVPLGHPVGSYSQYIRVFEDEYLGANMALDFDPVTNRAYETITEPTMKLKFIVKEERITSNREPGTLPQYDYPPAQPSSFRYPNIGPAAYRDSSTGNLLLAFASQRPTAGNTIGSGGGLGNWTIYSGILRSSSPQLDQTVPPPLLDLFGWVPGASDKWWSVGSGPYPTESPAALFDLPAGEVHAGSIQYFQPSFPVNASDMTTPYLFWQGSVGRRFQGEELTEYGIFYAPVNRSNGQLGAPIKMETGEPGAMQSADSRMPRYRPVAMSLGSGARLFWYGGTTGRYGLFMNETLDVASGTAWFPARSISTPAALVSAKDPYPVPKANGEVDLVYAGVTKDRNTNEIFLTTFRPRRPGAGIDWDRPAAQPRVTDEPAVADAGGKLWRTRGIDWLTFGTYGNESIIDVKVNNMSVLGDRERSDTGVMRYESRLGGYVVVDPEAGTVSFPNMAPGPSDVVTVSYTPRTIRLTSLGNVGGHTEPVAFIDTRPIGDKRLSFRQNGDLAASNDFIPVDRFWVLYKRGGTAAGQPSTLYTRTYRPGVPLPTPMAVFGSGKPVIVTVQGDTGFYTVDPVQGKVYFTQSDIGKEVQITYRVSGGGVSYNTIRAFVGWVSESSEAAVPIERAVAEGQVCAFADPVVEVDPGRPEFVWLFWSSTRDGASDIYYQSISPRFGAAPAGQ
jgi:hypothetical protein